MAKRIGRKRAQLPDCYYEGYLEKTWGKDLTPQKFWACLCGNSLFFFNEKRDIDYVDKLVLTELISVADDGTPVSNTHSTRFVVHMKSGSYRFTASNSEARELWKGFIHSVAELSVPSSLILLPGQIHMLECTIQKEVERLASLTSTDVTDHAPSPTSSQSDMPACFYEVPRLEAELLLEREANRGNLLLRPGRIEKSFAITTRLDLGGSVFKHYRVYSSPAGFYIDVDTPVYADTLQELVNILVERTEGHLTPLIVEGQYDKNISFISSDNENGERTQQSLQTFALTPLTRRQDEKTRALEAEPDPVREEHPSFADKKVGREHAIRDSSAASLSLTGHKKAPCPAPRRSLPSQTPTNNPGNPRRPSNVEAQMKCKSTCSFFLLRCHY
uniref:Signal transducing adaptor family member 2b n=1 Tax=Nothobranchius furzeri TaxID=105023 RepID=A0A1A8A823_NOTFU